jgi:hypothetical protein
LYLLILLIGGFFSPFFDFRFFGSKSFFSSFVFWHANIHQVSMRTDISRNYRSLGNLWLAVVLSCASRGIDFSPLPLELHGNHTWGIVLLFCLPASLSRWKTSKG